MPVILQEHTARGVQSAGVESRDGRAGDPMTTGLGMQAATAGSDMDHAPHSRFWQAADAAPAKRHLLSIARSAGIDCAVAVDCKISPLGEHGHDARRRATILRLQDLVKEVVEDRVAGGGSGGSWARKPQHVRPHGEAVRFAEVATILHEPVPVGPQSSVDRFERTARLHREVNDQHRRLGLQRMLRNEKFPRRPRAVFGKDLPRALTSGPTERPQFDAAPSAHAHGVAERDGGAPVVAQVVHHDAAPGVVQMHGAHQVFEGIKAEACAAAASAAATRRRDDCCEVALRWQLVCMCVPIANQMCVLSADCGERAHEELVFAAHERHADGSTNSPHAPSVHRAFVRHACATRAKEHKDAQRREDCAETWRCKPLSRATATSITHSIVSDGQLGSDAASACWRDASMGNECLAIDANPSIFPQLVPSN